MKINDVVSYFEDIINRYKFSDQGVCAQAELAEVLAMDGFHISAEVKVPNFTRPDSKRQRGGKIDLLASRDALAIGIEIDSWTTPKSKSIQKLSA